MESDEKIIEILSNLKQELENYKKRCLLCKRLTIVFAICSIVFLALFITFLVLYLKQYSNTLYLTINIISLVFFLLTINGAFITYLLRKMVYEVRIDNRIKFVKLIENGELNKEQM